MRKHPWFWSMLVGAMLLGTTILYVPSGRRPYVVAGVFVLLAAAAVYAYRTRRGLWKVAFVAVAALALLAYQVGIELASLLLTVPLAFAGVATALRTERRRSLVQILFFCRFPLLHGCLLLVLASIGLLGRPAGLATLLANLFEMRFRGLMLVTFLASLIGAVVAFGGLLLTRSAAAWIGAKPLADRRVTIAWAAFGAAGPVGIALALLLRSPLVGWQRAAAIACGALAAAVVLFVGRFVSLLLAPPTEIEGTRAMRWAAGREIEPAKKLVASVEAGLLQAPDALAQGYVSSGHLERGHLAAFTTGALVLVLYVLGYRVLDPGGSFEPPALSYVLLLVLVSASLLPSISFFLDRFRIPTTVAVVVLPAVLYFLNDLDHYYPLHLAPTAVAQTAAAGPAPPLPPRDEVLTAFRSRLARSRAAAPDREPLIVVVAASGGGITASLWTTTVLEALHERFGGELLDSIHLVSTVSGGSVGGMYFVDALNGSDEPLDRRLERARQRSARSSLSATAWGLAYPDLLRALSLTPDPQRDRGWAQERVWEKEFGDASPMLSDWRQPVRRGEIPLLILNATLCETGERYLLSPLRLVGLNACGESEAGCHDSFAGVSPWSLYGTERLPVVTAARLSATFPFVSPIARPGRDIATEDAYHVADGGYYDNFGVSTSVEWLRHAMTLAEREQAAGHGTARFLLLEIRASGRGSRPAARAGAGWIYASLGPAMTLFNVRNSSQIDRNDQEVSLLRELAQARGFELEAVDLTLGQPDAPLSWHLSEREQARIRAHTSAAHVQSSFDKIERFLARGRARGG
jgi:hypothetical protein